MSTLRLSIWVACAIVSFVMTTGANGESNTAPIRAAAITSWPPYSFMDPSTNKLVGFDIDVVDAIARELGRNVEWSESSFDQLISFNSLKTKRSDLIIAGLTDSPDKHERARILDNSYDSFVFFTTRSNAPAFRNMDAICGKRVSVTRTSVVMNKAVTDWNEENCIKAGKPPLVVLGTNGAPQSRTDLNQGRSEVAMQNAAALAYQNGVEDNRYFVVGTPIAKFMNGIAFNKDDVSFGDSLKTAFAKIIANGTYRQILEKWKMPDGTAVEKPMINGLP